MSFLRMTSTLFLFLLGLGGVCFPGSAQELESYKAGLSFYQTEEFEKAEEEFGKALKADPNNPYVLFNWGLAKLQLGEKGYAYAAWRKALSLDPTLTSAREALSYMIENIPLPGRRSPQGHWEVFRANVLVYFPTLVLIVLSVLFLCASGWILLKFVAERSSAVDNELPLPPIPWIGIAFALLFLVFQGLAIAKVIDLTRPRGVVVKDLVVLHSAPDENSSSLFEIAEGAEVLILRSAGDWLQVSYPSGLAGWAPSESIFQTSGKGI